MTRCGHGRFVYIDNKPRLIRIIFILDNSAVHDLHPVPMQKELWCSGYGRWGGGWACHMFEFDTGKWGFQSMFSSMSNNHIKMCKNFVTEHNPGFYRIMQYHISVWWVGWGNSRVPDVTFCCNNKGAGLLCVRWGGVLWMPPVHELHTLYRIQYHLGPALIRPLLPSLEWWVLEQQTNTVVAHVRANVDCELWERQKQTRPTDQIRE